MGSCFSVFVVVFDFLMFRFAAGRLTVPNAAKVDTVGRPATKQTITQKTLPHCLDKHVQYVFQGMGVEAW